MKTTPKPSGQNPVVQSRDYLQQILRQLEAATRSAQGPTAGQPVAAAQQAQARGLDPQAAYLNQQRADYAAEVARQNAAATTARMKADELAGPRRPGVDQRDVIGAQLAARREQGGLSLRQQVEAARQQVAYLKTPEGRARQQEENELNAELRQLQGQISGAAKGSATFAERMREIAVPVAVVTATFWGLERSARNWMEALSPTLADSLDASWTELAATLGDLVTPAFMALLKNLQSFTRWADQFTDKGEPDEPFKHPDKKGFDWWIKEAWDTTKETFRDAARNPVAAAAGPGTTINTIRNRFSRAGWLGEEQQQQANERERKVRAEPGPDLTAPRVTGVDMRSQFQSFQQYADALQLAALSLGDERDPKVRLMEKQIAWLEQHGKLLEDISANTRASDRATRENQAWR